MTRRPVALSAPILLAWLGAQAGGPAAQGAGPRSEPRPTPATAELFTDRAAELGLDFVHFNGMVGELYFPEMTGQGGALFDLDNDGDLDLYLVQGAPLGASSANGQVPFAPRAMSSGRGPITRTRSSAPDRRSSAAEPMWPDRVYRNLLERHGSPRLVDVTAEVVSPVDSSYGMGVAAGDYDNDGFIDLYVTNFGSNRLLRNEGGKLHDVTARAQADDPRWSTSASFLDYDRDGWLDLYVVNYVDYTVEKNPHCYARSSRRDYCGPAAFVPTPDRLLRNRGDGTFEEVPLGGSALDAAGPGLGVVAADFDGDGWLDIYVANDGAANFLWLNQRDGTFREGALLAGAALDRQGLPQAGMGVDAADFDADGDEDLFLTHLTGEMNTLYVNLGSGLFEDRSFESGLGPASLPDTGFGTAFFDYDNDGWLDLLIANGAVRILEQLAAAGDPYPLGQPNQLWRNLGDGRFEPVGPLAGPSFALLEVSRGAAFGDVDNDGDPDVLLLNSNGPARLLINNVGQRRSWLGLRLLDRSGRDALGARLGLERAGRPTLWRRVRTDGSYASASDPRVLFGLDQDVASTARVTVIWPEGRSERFEVPTRAYTVLRQGSGAAVPDAGEDEGEP